MIAAVFVYRDRSWRQVLAREIVFERSIELGDRVLADGRPLPPPWRILTKSGAEVLCWRPIVSGLQSKPRISAVMLPGHDVAIGVDAAAVVARLFADLERFSRAAGDDWGESAWTARDLLGNVGALA